MNIANVRKANNLSQRELAERVGITDSAICQYEQGKREPNVETLKKIAQVLGCTVDDLIKESDEN